MSLPAVEEVDVPMSYSGSWKMKEVRELRFWKDDERSRLVMGEDEEDCFLTR